MLITVHTNHEKDESVLAFSGDFTFDKYNEFAAVYRPLLGKSSRYVLDFTRLNYLDSSALGMMLLFKERAGVCDGCIVIRAQAGTVTDILNVARFNHLFTIETI